MPEADCIDQALRSADWWAQLDCARAWQRAGEALEDVDGGAARLAWRHSAESYLVYFEEHRAHLPASRWDHDFGPELSAADTRWRALPDTPPSPGRLPSWVLHALDRRFCQAVAQLRQAPSSDYERAIAKVLCTGCRLAGRQRDLERLSAWSLD